MRELGERAGECNSADWGSGASSRVGEVTMVGEVATRGEVVTFGDNWRLVSFWSGVQLSNMDACSIRSAKESSSVGGAVVVLAE
jgi:hypothetical protein